MSTRSTHSHQIARTHRLCRPLRVGLIAPPWVPVPPPVYGGTEAVIDQLARGLAAAGCDVRLFTTGDSTCPVESGWLYPRALTTRADQAAELAHVQAAYDFLADVDVIHDHTLTGPTELDLSSAPMPVVTTAHGEFTPELRVRYRAAAEQVSVIAISRAQRHSAPEVPIAAVIHHGLDVDSFPFGDGRGGYVMFLGRMGPDKGAHRAIAVARAAGRPIVLVAKMWEPAEHSYFTEVVEPLLGEDAVYVGEVGGQHKLELLGAAEALVNPIRWAEPFGLVMIEALACGTPVLTFPEGAAPEIVDHGRTGFLCSDEDDMASMVERARGLDRRECRSAVASRFSTARMVEDHLALYRRLLARRAAATRPDPAPMAAVGDVLRPHRPPLPRGRAAVSTS
jgi:glycosyltransferase involved in cell wall biosynthesis